MVGFVFFPDNKTRGLAPTYVFPVNIYSLFSTMGSASRAVTPAQHWSPALPFHFHWRNVCVKPLPAPHTQAPGPSLGWALVHPHSATRPHPPPSPRLRTPASGSSLCPFSLGQFPGMGLLPSLSFKAQSKYFSVFIKHLLRPIFNFSFSASYF